jgi:carbohydrate kinase (thermoresistant glucokinase family)
MRTGYARVVGHPVVLVMGVSGSGKTTVGRLLAKRAGWPFLDADELHTSESIAKMAAGNPLTDADRGPWLDRVASWIAERHAAGEPGVVACSALKRPYRDLLRRADPNLQLVYLRSDRDVLADRLAHRHGHFFAPVLLAAQLTDLDEPGPDEHPITVEIGQSPDHEVGAVLAVLEM